MVAGGDPRQLSHDHSLGRVVARHARAVPSAAPDALGSLPLDGAGRLAGDVEHDPVDLAHLVGDAGGDRARARRRAAAPSRRSSRPRRSPGAARPGGRRCGRRPARRPSGRRRAARPGTARSSRSSPAAVSSSRAIASASRRMSSRSRVTSPMMRMPEPGPGERLPPHDLGRAGPSSLADRAHLVLEQRAQRLDQLRTAGRRAARRRCGGT